jgi:hypothetical protein
MILCLTCQFLVSNKSHGLKGPRGPNPHKRQPVQMGLLLVTVAT